MALKFIRDNIAVEAGYHPDSSDEDKTYLNNKINRLVFDLYTVNDLVGSLMEIIVFYDDTLKLVSFPWYVGDVRGARYYDSPIPITLRDIRPRYATDSYGIQMTDFREVGISSLAVQLEEWSVLKFSLPEGEVADEDIIIGVVGETPTSSNHEEQIVILEGENNATSVSNWINAPRIIQKSKASQFDIIITDSEDNEVAVFPNGELRCQFSIWQVRDDNLIGQISANSLEILYKNRLMPLVNDYDEFLNGKYDDVIIWKFLDEFFSRKEGMESQAAEAKKAWVVKMGQVNNAQAKGKKAELQSVPNKFYSLFNGSAWRNPRR
jgi:hypothetical protein